MQDVDDCSLGSDEYIRRAAEDTLREWPEATAAVLYGSRARGDCRSDSDWDIAIMTRTAEYLPEGMALQRLGGDCEIQLLPMSEERMHRKCNAPGHVAFNIARQGRVLAGRWKAPPLKENPRMQHEEFDRWYGHAETYLQTVVTRLVYLARRYRFQHAEQFVAASSQAAEHLVKGMICRHCGILPDKTHDVESLARMLPEPLRQKAGELNGTTVKHHVADYVGINPTDCQIAGRRVVLTIELLTEELVRSKEDASTARAAEQVARELILTAWEWVGPLREPADQEAVSAMGSRAGELAVAALKQREPLAKALEAALVKLEQITARDPAPHADDMGL